MMKSPIIRSLIIASVSLAALGGALTSCSPDQVNVLSTVPDSAPVVMTFDANRFMAAAGLRLDGSTLTAEPSIAHSPFDLAPLGAETYSELMQSIDAAHTVFFVSSARVPYLSFIVTDSGKFGTIMEQYGDAQTSQGFKTWDGPDGLKFTLCGNQGWISRDPQAAASLKGIVDRAAEQSVMQSIGIANALQDNNNLFNFALNTGGEYRYVAQGNEESGALGIDVRAMKPDGALMTLTQTQTLSEDFLRYTGPATAIAAAIGLRPEFTSSVNWNAVANTIENMTGLGASPISMVAPLMADVDGTVSVALAPANDEAWEEPSLANWSVTVMAHMPQHKVNDALNTFRSYFALGGLKVTTDARTGMMTVPFYGSMLHVGPVDGYLAISNTPMDGRDENSLTPVFNGKQGALYASLPPLDFVPGMKKGMKIAMQLETDRLHVKLSPVDESSPVLGSLMGMFITLTF